ncbi:MAG: MFS transporter [Asticcacaulis sp.]
MSAAPLTPLRVALFAFACGVIVGNLYYAQPLIALIAPEVHLSDHAASAIVSLTQLGYVAGLLFVVPLADLVENKRLILVSIGLALVSLILSALAKTGAAFLGLSFLIGVTAVAVQILVPFAAHLATDETRGRVVGNVMGGLLLGILLSRPLASLIADHFGWRTVFFVASGFMVAIASLLVIALPQRAPSHSQGYFALMRSMGGLIVRHATLRQRALFQGCMFCAFSLFWTASPLELARHFHLNQTQIAFFALAGAAGAIAAPLSGRLADAGYGTMTTFAGLGLGAVSMLLSLWGPFATVIGLALCGIGLDAAVQTTMVQGQRVIYALDPDSRARINGIYMASIFIGGATGSALASPLYASFGWDGIAAAAAIMPLLALLIFVGGKPKPSLPA